MNRMLATALLVLFGAYSVWVVAAEGATGFLTLAWDEPWAMQVLLDLVIALVMVLHWLVPDARARGRATWPWVVGTVLLGSLAPLAYAATRRRQPRPAPTPGHGATATSG